MAFKSSESIDMDKLASFLQDAVEKVKNEEDPLLLNELKKVFRKNVPLSLRSYVTAYMVKTLSGNSLSSRRSPRGVKKGRNFDTPRSKAMTEKASRKSSRLSEVNEERFQKAKPNVIDESLATTLFFSIGRNRKVYHGHLISLIASVAEIDRERIGLVRPLDNYSFVQVYAEDAQTIIEKLNGYEYRGRKLTVSFSHKKENDSSDSSVNESYDQSLVEENEESKQEA